MADGERDLRPEIERIKERKDGLDVLHDLLVAARGGGFHSLSPDDLTLAKWWGIYPQRPEEDGYLMLRVRVAERRCRRREQLRAIGDLSVRFGRSTGDVTTRQCLQLHWLRIEDVPEIFDTLDAIGLTSAQACGDVWRNVVGCPLAGVTADEFFDSAPDRRRAVDALRRQPALLQPARASSRSRSARCRHHCAQHEINDIGLVGVVDPELGMGYDVWVGGGLGASARMGRRLGVFARDRRRDRDRRRADRDLPRPRQPPQAHPRPLEVPRRRVGRRPRARRARAAPRPRAAGRPADPSPPLSPMRDHVGVSPQREPGRCTPSAARRCAAASRASRCIALA